MKHMGDYDASAVIYGKFSTFRPSTGAAFTLGGTPALSVYKDNSTTQSTTGVTLTVDFDSVTGLHHFAIDTSADGTFYAAGSFFDIVITTGTVDSVSVVGSVVASFTIRKDSSLKPTVAARTLDVSAGGEAGVDWANVGSPTTAVNLSATNIDVDQVVASVSGAVGSVTGAVGSVTGAVGSVTGAVGSVTGNVGGNVVGSVGSVTGLTAANLDVAVSTRLASAGYTAPDNASIAAILTDTAEIGVAGAGLTNINLPDQTMNITGDITGNLSGSVGSVTGAVGSVTGAVGSVTGNVGGNVVGSVASVTAGVTLAANAITAAATAADFTTEIQAGLATAAALATVDTNVSAILVDTAEIGAAGAGLTALASQTSVNDLPTNAELATALDALPTAAENATAVLTTAMTESYRADGATGTLAQMQYEIIGHLGESSIVSTTKTIKKVDGTTTAATFTLDSDTAPTSITRAT